MYLWFKTLFPHCHPWLGEFFYLSNYHGHKKGVEKIHSRHLSKLPKDDLKGSPPQFKSEMLFHSQKFLTYHTVKTAVHLIGRN